MEKLTQIDETNEIENNNQNKNGQQNWTITSMKRLKAILTIQNTPFFENSLIYEQFRFKKIDNLVNRFIFNLTPYSVNVFKSIFN